MDTISGDTNLLKLFFLSSEKGSTLNEKHLFPVAPRGSKCFPFSVDPLSEGARHAVKQTGS